jgi:predicted metal-dependent peptidase
MTRAPTSAQRAHGKIQSGLQRLAARYPFHVAVLERLRLTPEPRVGTMGVTLAGDDVLLLYNDDFVLGLPADELCGVLLHEVHHVVFGHVLADPRDFPDKWARTVAEEVTVNEFITLPLPEGCITLGLFPNLPPMESTGERYERLKKVKKRTPISSPSALAGSGGDAGLQTTDDHEVWQQAVEDREAAQEAIRVLLQEAAIEAGTDSLPEAFQDALEALGVGDTPGSEKYRLRGNRRGHLDWRTLLRRYVGEVLEPDASLARPPRRFPELVGIVPGRSLRPTRPEVMAVIDTSGSITNRLLEMIDGELRPLARTSSVTVVECDADIHRVFKYRPLESVTGRGGTDFRPPLDDKFLRKHRADLVIYFTDGFGPAPERAPRVPVIWCLVPKGQAPAPWGRVIQMDKNRRMG